MRYVTLLLAFSLLLGCETSDLGISAEEPREVWYHVYIHGEEGEVPVDITYRVDGEMKETMTGKDWLYTFETTDPELYLEIESDLQDTQVRIEVDRQEPANYNIESYDDGKRKVATASLR